MRIILIFQLVFLLSTSAGFTSSAQAADLPSPEGQATSPETPSEFMGNLSVLTAGNGIKFKTYAVGPKESATGILLLHEWWGLNDHIKGLADRFAKLGYRVLAIDLYGGRIVTSLDDARRLMKSVNQQMANLKLKTAVGNLWISGRKLATVGLSFGGGQALQAALQAPEKVSATVVYYGELEIDVKKLETLSGPVLGIFASEDKWITSENVLAFKAAMTKADKTLEAYQYRADHGFANPSSPNYNEQAAQAAWNRTQTFLRRYLQ